MLIQVQYSFLCSLHPKKLRALFTTNVLKAYYNVLAITHRIDKLVGNKKIGHQDAKDKSGWVYYTCSDVITKHCQRHNRPKVLVLSPNFLSQATSKYWPPFLTEIKFQNLGLTAVFIALWVFKRPMEKGKRNSGTLSLILFTSKYFRRKIHLCPSF